MSSPPPAPPWVDSLRWQLLPLLRQQAVLRLDTRACLNLEAWLDAAQTRGWLSDEPAGARGAVRSILCKSAREQEAFDLTFDQWLERWDRPAPAAATAAREGTALDAAAVAQAAALARQLQQRLWLFALGGALLLLGAIVAGRKLWPPAPPVVLTPVAASAALPASAAASQVVMKLEVQLPTAAEAASAAAATPAPPPPPPTPSSAWLAGIHPGWYAAFVLLAASVGLAVRRTRQRYVQRISTREHLREQEVYARQLLPVSGTRREGLRSAARLLRRPVADGGAMQLDLLASVRASAARAGLFSAVHRQRPAIPEYLVLVDRARSGDQQAHWAIETAQDLVAEGVRLALYEFDRDPRWVAPLRSQRSGKPVPQQRYVPLAALTAQHAAKGLLVLGDGEGLLDRAAGGLQPWLAAALAPWPRRVLMTPRPFAAWAAAEDVLAGEGQKANEASFLLVPSQHGAWLAAARWLRGGTLATIAAVPGAPAAWPPLLADDTARWLSNSPPTPADMVALLEQLRAYLGSTAYHWLAASAAYPYLSADLTAWLAHQLDRPAAAGEAVASPDARLLEARLVAIAQLPWCRQGLMPDWLRRALLLSLPPTTRRRVRDVMAELLDTTADAGRSAGGWSLGAVASDSPASGWKSRWQALRRRIGLAGVLEAEPLDSPLRDVVYLGLLRGEFDAELSLEATEQFARAASAEGPQRASRNPLRWLAAVGLCGWFVLCWAAWRVLPVKKSASKRAGVADGAAPSQPTLPGTPADVYISYHRDDAGRVRQLVEALRANGLSVSLDTELLRGGDYWREVTQQAVDGAKCVIVVWSEASVGTQVEFVRHEALLAALQAKPRGALFPVLLDEVEPPPDFRHIHPLDLVGWKGSARDPRVAGLCAAVRAMVAGTDGPPVGDSLKRPVSRKVTTAPDTGPRWRDIVLPVLHPLPPPPASWRVRAARGAFWLALSIVCVAGVLVPVVSPDTWRPAPQAAAAPLPAPAPVVAQRYPAGTRLRDCGDPTLCPWLRVLPPGRFLMGSPASEPGRSDDEGPQHAVTIAAPPAVMETEVTRGQFAAFVSATGHVSAAGGCYAWNGKKWELDPQRNWRSLGFEQTDAHPVVCVDWNDATAYAAWLSKTTGQTYRLLTEAEWEYAARAGSTTRYSFGDRAEDLCAHANMADRTFKGAFKEFTTVDCSDGQVFTAPVASYAANAWGLFDLHGNAWEWVADCWHHDYKNSPEDGSNWQANCSGEDRRVLRGGGWIDNPVDARSAFRNMNAPDDRSYDSGFRLARTLTP